MSPRPEPPVRLVVPPARPVLPWVAAIVVATAWALTGPLPVAAGLIVLAGAVFAWAAARDRAQAGSLRTAAVAAFAVLVVGTTFTPAWLHLLAGIALDTAFAVGAALAVRLAAVLLVGLTLTVLRGPRDWLAAVRPWPRLGLVLAVAWRQVHEVAHDVERVRRAQRARGLLVGRGAGRARSLLTPVMTRSLERADRVGRSLAIAGWGPGTRSALVRTRYRAVDVAVAAAALVAGGAWALV